MHHQTMPAFDPAHQGYEGIFPTLNSCSCLIWYPQKKYSNTTQPIELLVLQVVLLVESSCCVTCNPSKYCTFEQ
jgi:hypothetical protein